MTERYSNLMKKEIFHIELGNGIYLISSTEFGTDTAMGKPTANSYLTFATTNGICSCSAFLIYSFSILESVIIL